MTAARALGVVALGLVAACDVVFGGDAFVPDQTPPVGDWSLVVGGPDHTCALDSAGSLWCWGRGDNGQLGDGRASSEHVVPVRIGTAAWKTVAARSQHMCGIQSDDTLHCWGANDHGQLGLGTPSAPVLAPTRVGGERWKQVAVETFHTCAIRDDDTLWCWGSNALGWLGHGTRDSAAVPLEVAGGGAWTALALGAFHTCAIRDDATLWCWGANIYGQLGEPKLADEVASDGVSRYRSTPGPVGSDRWTHLAAGTWFQCGRRDTGQLRCWGENGYGQLGNGSNIPHAVPRAVGFDDAADWTSVVAGPQHACALRGTGALWCWGANTHGQALAPERGVAVSSPAPIGGGPWTAVGAGRRHTCAIARDRDLWCAGSNGSGQLSLESGGSRPSPTQVDGAWTHVAVGSVATCAIDTAGAAWCWGDNLYGQLGDGTHLPRSRPSRLYVGGPWTQLAIADDHACGVRDTALWCWGLGNAGQRGDGMRAISVQPVPQLIASGPDEVAVDGLHGLARSGNTVSTWGYNQQGQLGTGGKTSSERPTPIAGAYLGVGAGDNFSCAIDTTNAVRCWGDNQIGQLGIGAFTTEPVVTPDQPVAGVALTEKLVVGSAQSCAIDFERSARCWGYVDGRAEATAIALPGTWLALALGRDHACGIQPDGSLWCWGANAYGQLGDGTFDARDAPTQIGSARWQHVAADGGVAGAHTCAIRDDDTLWCWGSNRDGELGDGTAFTAELTRVR